MVHKVILFLALFGAASSELPDRRSCDPEQRQEMPTLCSNYKNLLHLDDIQRKLEEKQTMLQQRIDAMESKSRLQLEAANGNISALETLVTNLSSALSDLERVKSQIGMEFRDAKTQLEKHSVDIASLRKEVQELVKQGERLKGNFSEIQQRLDTTEGQLQEIKVELEHQTETEAAVSNTQRFLNLYKPSISEVKSLIWNLEVKLEEQMDATETKLEAKLQKIQNNNEVFSAKLYEQNAKFEQLKEETDSKFRNVDARLKTQKTTLDEQKAHINALKNDTAEIKYRLRSAEEKVVEQSQLKLDVNSLKAEVNAKVAFSATIIESYGVFTGPNTGSTSSILIFNRVFTNTGNSYNSATGIFTAPLKGVYHFSFMTFGYSSHTSGAILVKNGLYQVSTWEFRGLDASDTTSNTVILQLYVGDTVNIILWDGGKIHTAVFSGFLLFSTA